MSAQIYKMRRLKWTVAQLCYKLNEKILSSQRRKRKQKKNMFYEVLQV